MMTPGKTSDHFNGRIFHNAPPRAQGFFALLRWLTNRQRGSWSKTRDFQYGPKPPASVPGPNDASDALRITWINHSTLLIQCFGVNILTDPIWSDRASPVTFAGPRRMHPPGIRFEDLPRIHAVLLSHDHYDHFDVPTLRRVWRRDHPAFYTGLGNGRRLRRLGITRFVEMDWWDTANLPGGLHLICTPARHFSGRTPFDRDSTLWCSFAIEPPPEFRESGVVYFGADTGFGAHFAQIAERVPPLRASILPIGAYRPEWFMGEVHCSPAESVEAHRILHSPLSIGCHFGTFPLADDGEDEPREALVATLSANPVEGRFIVPEFGAPVEPASLAVARETID